MTIKERAIDSLRRHSDDYYVNASPTSRDAYTDGYIQGTIDCWLRHMSVTQANNKVRDRLRQCINDTPADELIDEINSIEI